MSKVRHVLGISGGKDSAALAIYMKNKHSDIPIEYYNSDTGCELEETIEFVKQLKGFLGHIEMLVAAKDSPEPTPFDHFLKANGGYLPSPQARWCTQKMKLAEFEDFVKDDYAISYVGIRGDEQREGYVSTKSNIQSIFPFRKNIWSLDVITKVLNDDNIDQFSKYYKEIANKKTFDEVRNILLQPLTKSFFYSKKLNYLLDTNIVYFNKAVFEWLKTTDYPVGKLDSFPLVENTDNLNVDDIKKILIDGNAIYCLKTLKLFDDVSNIFNLGVYCVEPGYKGTISTYNYTGLIRCYIPFFIPSGDNGIIINEKKIKWNDMEKSYILFEHRDHILWNYTDTNLFILFMDILNK